MLKKEPQKLSKNITDALNVFPFKANPEEGLDKTAPQNSTQQNTNENNFA